MLRLTLLFLLKTLLLKQILAGFVTSPSIPAVTKAMALESLPKVDREKGTAPYEYLIVDPKERAESIVFLIHGVSGKAEDFLPIVEPFQQAGINRTRFVIPQAPTRYLQLFDVKFTSWFNLRRNRRGFVVATSEDEVVQAAANLNKIIEHETQTLGISRKQVVLLGHSQGGALSLTTYLRYKIGGCIGLATFLPIPRTYPMALTNYSANAPALLIHGSEDKIVLAAQARRTKKKLRKLKRDVVYTEYENEGHSLLGVVEEIGDQTFHFLHKNLYQS